MELCYAAADAHNRMITDFCSIDRRLLAVAYVPLEDFDRSLATAKLAIELGAKALMVPSLCPQHHSPSHVALDPVWATAQEAGIPVVLHVGGERKLNPVYKENGLPPVPDFHGGDDNFTSVSYMPIPEAAMQTLACSTGSLTSNGAPSNSARTGCPAGCGRWIRPRMPSCAMRSVCRN